MLLDNQSFLYRLHTMPNGQYHGMTVNGGCRLWETALPRVLHGINTGAYQPGASIVSPLS